MKLVETIANAKKKIQEILNKLDSEDLSSMDRELTKVTDLSRELENISISQKYIECILNPEDEG